MKIFYERLYNYKRMTKLRQVCLIIVLLVTLVALPPILSGFFHLSVATSAHDNLEASAEYETAARLLFWRRDLYERAALSALDAQQAVRAIKMFALAQRSGGLTSNGQLMLGDAYLSAGETEKAISEWEGLLNAEQVRGGASSRLAGTYFQRGQFEDAERALRQWLDFDPQNTEASYRLGLLLMADAAPEALPLLESARNDPQLASRADELSSALKNALAESAPVYRLTVCGRALAAIGEWTLAERAFIHAANIDADYAPAWAWLGEALQQTGRGNAIGALQKAVALSPTSAELRVMLALYWQRKNDWPHARDELTAAARLEPQNPLWQMALGGAYVHLGNLVTALEYYQNAVQLSPSDTQTWRALALFCVENSAYIEDVGLNAALQAFALEPGSAENVDILGRALLLTGETDSAEALFKKALALAPGNPSPVFHLGLLYLQTGQLNLARQALLSAQTLDPAGPIGAQAAKVLERYLP
jgi:tetratricopeptide (TPR) repeat protein